MGKILCQTRSVFSAEARASKPSVTCSTFAGSSGAASFACVGRAPSPLSPPAVPLAPTLSASIHLARSPAPQWQGRMQGRGRCRSSRPPQCTGAAPGGALPLSPGRDKEGLELLCCLELWPGLGSSVLQKAATLRRGMQGKGWMAAFSDKILLQEDSRRRNRR